MNMFKPVASKKVNEYLKAAPEDKKELVQRLHQFIQETVPDLEVWWSSNMIGYGSFSYTNYKKEEIEWPIIALAYRKNYVSVYACCTVGDQYVAEKYQDQLGKVSVGKSCIRIKKFEDLDQTTFRKVLTLAADNPGY